MDTKVFDLEFVVEHLVTEEAKHYAVYEAASRSFTWEVHISRELANAAIKFFEGEAPNRAAIIAETSGDIDRAIKIHEGIVKSAKDKFDALQALGNIGRLYEQKGDIDKAMELYWQNGMLALVARLELNRGNIEKAVELLWKSSSHDRLSAINIAVQHNFDPERIRQMYETVIAEHEQKGEYRVAADYAEKAGLTQRAVELRKKEHELNKQKKHLGATYSIEMALAAGDVEAADAIYSEEIVECEKDGNFQRASHIAEARGNTERAKAYKMLNELVNPDGDS